MKVKTFKKKYNYRHCQSCQTCAHRDAQFGGFITCALMDEDAPWQCSPRAVCDKYELPKEEQEAQE